MSLSAGDSVLLAQLATKSWLEIFGTIFLGLVALLLLKLGPKQFLFYLSRPYDTFILVKYVAFARAKVPKDISSDMKWYSNRNAKELLHFDKSQSIFCRRHHRTQPRIEKCDLSVLLGLKRPGYCRR